MCDEAAQISDEAVQIIVLRGQAAEPGSDDDDVVTDGVV